ncbi:MAG: acetate kinase [Oscillospiraceae bacterium]|nr:acetate kinase [Oscillospiraceae bacterium]
MKILVINCGSSSLKYQLLDMEGEKLLAKGLCERIGIDGHLTHKPQNGKPTFNEDVAMPTHTEAIAAVLDKLTSAQYGVVDSMSEIGAVGHRVVHGGEKFAASVRIDDAVLSAISECIPLAPLHNPANITGIEACKAVMGDVPQVAVFDTAFHQSMPGKAFMYAIPYEYYTDLKVRRYGFHGTSHRYVAKRAAEMLGKPLEELKLISCHMGNGSSICAIDGGRSVDTSMGFTPIAGLPMGTRCGDIDVSILEYLAANTGKDVKELTNILNKKSGVLGVSGISSDFRDLDNAAQEGNDRAALALEMFCYAVAKTVGGYVAAMNGVDGIIFTAGIGENSADTRAGICEYLGYLGISICSERNAKRGEDTFISTDDSRVRVMVIPTNEELVIARDTRDIVLGK